MRKISTKKLLKMKPLLNLFQLMEKQVNNKLKEFMNLFQSRWKN